MSRKLVILGAPSAAPWANKCKVRLLCMIHRFVWLPYKGINYSVLAILFCLVSTQVHAADERLPEFEHRALVAYANTESAYFQRANVLLVAPELQQQLQDLADQICLAAGTERHFKVYVFNDGYPMTRSLANGDIFISAGYLDMVENKDELAFGLSREIAMQVKDLPLKEEEKELQDARRTNRWNLVTGIIVSSTISAIYGKYGIGKLDQKIIQATGFRPTVMLVGLKTAPPQSGGSVSRGPGGVIKAPAASGPQLEGVYGPDFNYQHSVQQLGQVTDGLANWLPNLINKKILTMTSRLVSDAFKEADPERRKFKNQLGIEFMQIAGYNGASGQNVVKKLDEFSASTDTSTNAPNNKLK